MFECYSAILAVFYRYGIRCASQATTQGFDLDGRWRSAINYTNPLGTKGKLAHAFAKLLLDMWHGEHSYITPYEFRV